MNMRMIFATGAALVLLGGCQPESQQNAADNMAAELKAVGNDAAEANAVGNDGVASNFIAQLTGFGDRERNVVIVRAIMDSEKKCDGVIKSDREPDNQGLPSYHVYCRNGAEYRVIFSADGAARVY
jgi:hypothetical protein